jgi:hypothetical protein
MTFLDNDIPFVILDRVQSAMNHIRSCIETFYEKQGYIISNMTDG